jgi:hypothetical protein
VTALQTLLGLEPSGRFDRSTMAALRSWQTTHALAPTGVTDTFTAAALGLRMSNLAGDTNLTEPASDDVTPVRRVRAAALAPATDSRAAARVGTPTPHRWGGGRRVL